MDTYWFNTQTSPLFTTLPCLWFQYEMELYQNESACQTPLDRQYHSEVKALSMTKGRRNSRIFTYTDHDRYTNCQPVNQSVSIWKLTVHKLILPPGLCLICYLLPLDVARHGSVFESEHGVVKNNFMCLFPFGQYSAELVNTNKSSPTFLAERMANLRQRRQERRTMYVGGSAATSNVIAFRHRIFQKYS